MYSSSLSLSFPRERSTFLRVAFRISCSIEKDTSFVFSPPPRGRFPPALLLSVFLFFVRFLFVSPVSSLSLKVLPDEVVRGGDHRCQLRGTGSRRLISSYDHSRMNRSTWATTLTIPRWVADYERMGPMSCTIEELRSFFSGQRGLAANGCFYLHALIVVPLIVFESKSKKEMKHLNGCDLLLLQIFFKWFNAADNTDRN